MRAVLAAIITLAVVGCDSGADDDADLDAAETVDPGPLCLIGSPCASDADCDYVGGVAYTGTAGAARYGRWMRSISYWAYTAASGGRAPGP